MIEQQGIQQKLNEIFARKLSLHVPSIDTDLVATGLLDSLTLIELITHLDETFGISISTEDLELENLRSIASIARVVSQRMAVVEVAMP